MKDPSIHLPVFQRFDCQSCAYCCRNFIVNVSDKERQRILDAGWEQKLPGQPLFVAYRFSGRQLYHLARRPDGACVFLDENNLCRIHAETGAASKPLACRAYPFVATPGADRVRIDVRLDCPSAAANQGRPISVHAPDLGRIAAQSDIDGAMTRIPTWPRGRELTAEEFIAVAEAFERILLSMGEPLRRRLRAGCHLLDLLYAANIENVRKLRFLELMNLLTNSALEQAREDFGAPAAAPDGCESPQQEPLPVQPELGRRTDKLFRQWLFLHTLVDDPDAGAQGRLARWRHSWQRWALARRFARATGSIPRLRPDWPNTTFEAVAAFETAPDDAWEPLHRAMRIKLEAHAFAGPGYFGYDLLSGLTALWLLPAVSGWLARLSAAGRGGTVLTADDVLAGVRRAHHTFGVSPVFANVSEKLRMRTLAKPGVPAAILAAYGP